MTRPLATELAARHITGRTGLSGCCLTVAGPRCASDRGPAVACMTLGAEALQA